MENKSMWVSPECDFEDLRSDGRYADIVRLVEENANLLISLCLRNMNDELKNSIRFGMVMLSYFERSLQKETEEGALFWAGKLMGHIEALEKLRFASEQDLMAFERARLLAKEF